MLQQYGPDLLVQCKNVSALSNELVRNWLTTYMFRGQQDGAAKAGNIATWLASHDNHKMHGRYLNRDVLRGQGLNIINLEDDKDQQDTILSIFHATTHTFTQSGATKIIENHLGHAFINQMQRILIQQDPQAPAVPGLPGKTDIRPPFPKKKPR